MSCDGGMFEGGRSGEAAMGGGGGEGRGDKRTFW